MADKYIAIIGGRRTEVEGTVSSGGVSNAGELVALDGAGRLDESVLPVGVGPDVISLEATENVAAGKYVNIFNSAGTPKVRLADNSNDRPAHGFVKDTVSMGQSVNVYFEGPNENLSSLTPGSRYYLSTAGAPTASVPTAPTAQILQFLGIAVSATSINTDVDDEVVLDQ